MSDKTGGLAFPLAGWSYGMTLRDYFAAEMMPTIVNNFQKATVMDRREMDLAAHMAYLASDALLRQKKLPPLEGEF